MIKINSELPMCMLGKNNTYNEYDFVLFHLYVSSTEYRNYYLNQRRTNPSRLMILDNSAYEFYVKGEQLDLQEFFEAICELKPDMYILPDVLMSKEKTLGGVHKFIDLYIEDIHTYSPGSNPMAVAQGITEDELVECLNLYNDMGIKCVAIPFHNTFFKDMGCDVASGIEEAFCMFHCTSTITDDMRYSMGRVRFVRSHSNLLSKFWHVHMLGSHSVAEKAFYSHLHTMDTAYPVKCAIEGYMLGMEPHKPEVIIDEFLNTDLPKETQYLISTNVLKFRNL